MTDFCPSCGGILGRDCFNPIECAEITHQMAMDRQRDDTPDIESIRAQAYREGQERMRERCAEVAESESLLPETRMRKTYARATAEAGVKIARRVRQLEPEEL